jgi:hypothetical protein
MRSSHLPAALASAPTKSSAYSVPAGFSFGLVLYEMAVGRSAFRGATSAVVAGAILHDTPPAPRGIRADMPERLEEVILSASIRT